MALQKRRRNDVSDGHFPTPLNFHVQHESWSFLHLCVPFSAMMRFCTFVDSQQWPFCHCDVQIENMSNGSCYVHTRPTLLINARISALKRDEKKISPYLFLRYCRKADGRGVQWNPLWATNTLYVATNIICVATLLAECIFRIWYLEN